MIFKFMLHDFVDVKKNISKIEGYFYFVSPSISF
jgi:hypothetical protein